MKKILRFFCVAFFILSIRITAMSQISITTGTTVQANLPIISPTSFDRLRVQAGLLTHYVSGNVGSFGTTDKWIGIGEPLTSLYGKRIQWNGQALNTALRERTVNGIKDALIEWGNGGGEMQFRYVTNPNFSTSFTKILSLTAAGNAYMGSSPTPFVNSKFDINTSQQLALYCKTVDFNTVIFEGGSSVSNSNTRTTLEVKAGTTSITNAFSEGIRVNAFNGTASTGITSTASNSFNSSGASIGVLGSATGGGGGLGPAFGISGDANFGSVSYGVYGSNSFNNNPFSPNIFAGYFNGRVFATSYTTPSDEKLKSKINNEDGYPLMSKIRQLNPVTYYYDNKSIKDIQLPESLQHGFVAQELKKTFPEMVSEISHPVFGKDKSVTIEKFLGVNYNMMISVLTKALQEEDTYIQSLEKRIIELEKKFLTNQSQLLTGFDLSQNVPNPFNGITTIKYSVPATVKNAGIAVFDLNGKMLLQYSLVGGSSQILIDASMLSPGMYFYSLLNNGQEMITKKMIVSR